MRRQTPKTKPHSHPERRRRIWCEPLEDRRMLCGLSHEFLIDPPDWDQAVEQRYASLWEGELGGSGGGGGPEAVGIEWINRGQASDNFDATFGTSAAAARAVVDAAIDDWERIITNWNRNDQSLTLQINVSINGAGFTAGGAPAATAPADGKPRTGSITIASGNNSSDPNDSNGWYLDPNPYDWSEFTGPITNAFSGTSASIGPDFYSFASAEIAHVLGLISDRSNAGGNWNNYRLETSGMATNTNMRDNSEGGGSFGFFWVFDGPTVDHLMTSYNSGDANSASWGNVIHTAGGGGNINFNNVNYQSSEDVGNAIVFIGERTIPSWVTAHILADAYAYTIKEPDSFGTMYASLNSSNGQLTIQGGAGASIDVITVSSYSLVGTSFLEVAVDVGNDIPGTRHLPGAGNLPAWTSTFLANSVSSIVINSGGGQDFIRIEGNADKPVTVNAGAGDDYIDFSFLARNLSNIGASTHVFGGDGFDSILAYDNNTPATWTYSVDSSRFDRPGWGGFLYSSDVESLTLTTGAGADTVNVTSTFAGQPVYLNSAGGEDTVNVGNPFTGVASIQAPVQIDNDPWFTRLNISDQGNAIARTAEIGQFVDLGYIAGLAPANILWDNADIREIRVTTGEGADSVNVLRNSERLFLSNSNGVDQITIGNSTTGMAEITGGIDVGPNPPFVLTDLRINDVASTFDRSFHWVPDGNGFILTGLAAGMRFENVRDMQVLAGSGNDQFTLNGVARSVRVDGGGGFDSLLTDDRSMPFDLVLSHTYADRFERSTGGVFPTEFTTYFTNVESPTLYLDESSTNNTIHGTSSSILPGSQVTLYGGPQNDTFIVKPRDANGDASILGALGIIGSGGVDSLIVDDTMNSTGTTWVINNLFGAGTQNFSVGAGTYFGSAEIENITLSGSAGDDSFNLDQYASGTALRIFGNDGWDTLEAAANTLDLAASLTSIAAFDFDGGDGYDQMILHNELSQGGWDYVRTNDYFRAIGPFYSLTLNNTNTEYLFAMAGAQTDNFHVLSVPSNSVMAFEGGDGTNHYEIGDAGLTGGIHGAVQLFASVGFNTVTIDNSADPLGRTVHVDVQDVGAVPGDDLFGPGGYLLYSNFLTLTLRLGTGDDTVYATPHPVTEIVIEDPNPPIESTDFMGLAFANVTNPVFTPDGAAGGTYTFDNAAPLTYQGIELTQIDATAPQVVAAAFDELPMHTVRFQFDEDVSASLQAADLLLTDAVSGQLIQVDVISLEYDANDNSARFMFPGLAGGALPAGSYSATLNPGVSDLFGNPLAAFTPFEFSVNPITPDGDFNDDGFYDLLDIDALIGEIAAATHNPAYDLTGDGIVDLADRDAWLAEAGSVNLPTGNAYLLGDANLDGVVDGQDFIAWNAHKFQATARWRDGDFNADGVVDGQDFIIWNAHKFQSADMTLVRRRGAPILKKLQ